MQKILAKNRASVVAQKKLSLKKIALTFLSTLSISLAAFNAQANHEIKIYGQINSGGYFTDSKESNYGLFSDRSLLGFKGYSDLVPGLKTFFNIETGFDSVLGGLTSDGFMYRGNEHSVWGTGKNRGFVGFDREVSVGVYNKDFGSVKIGRSILPYYDRLLVNYDPFHGSRASPQSLYRALPFQVSNYLAPGLFYYGPVTAGFSVDVYGALDHRPNTSGFNKWGVNLNFDRGPFQVSAGYLHTAKPDFSKMAMHDHAALQQGFGKPMDVHVPPMEVPKTYAELLKTLVNAVGDNNMQLNTYGVSASYNFKNVKFYFNYSNYHQKAQMMAPMGVVMGPNEVYKLAGSHIKDYYYGVSYRMHETGTLALSFVDRNVTEAVDMVGNSSTNSYNGVVVGYKYDLNKHAFMSADWVTGNHPALLQNNTLFTNNNYNREMIGLNKGKRAQGLLLTFGVSF